MATTSRWRKVGGRLSILVVLAAVAVAGVQGYRRLQPPVRAAIRTELVTRGPVIGALRLEGLLQPEATVRVGSLSAGQVTAVLVAVGERVKRGQDLARLENLEQRAALADARASANGAEIQRMRAEKRFVEELGKLDAAGAWSGDLDPDDLLGGAAGNAQLDLMSAAVHVERADSKRALARGVLARRIIRSPLDGVVLARNIDPGETISSSPPGPPLFVIGSDPTRLRLEAEIDDAYVARVRPTSVPLTVAGHPRRSFTAQLRQVLPANPLAASGGLYRLVLDVENKDGALRPGMKATFGLPLETVGTTLRLPVAALVAPPPHAGPRDAVVLVVDGRGALTRVPVEVGVANDRLAEIRAGSLRPGAAVVVSSAP